MGNILRILDPFLTRNLMSGDIPMIEKNFPVMVTRHPQVLNEIPVNYNIQGNNAIYFVQNSVTITANHTLSEETTFSGLFFDNQCVDDWLGHR